MAFTIGDLAEEFGVSLRTLRFYEDKNLISPKRSGLTRVYSRRDRARIKLIIMGKRIGFSLREIKGLLDLYEQENGREVQLKTSLKRFNEQIEFLEKQKQETENAIEELSQTIVVVEKMLTKEEGYAEAI